MGPTMQRLGIRRFPPTILTPSYTFFRPSFCQLFGHSPFEHHSAIYSLVPWMYCNKFAGSIQNGSLLHLKLNTQLLITVHNSSRNLTHVWQNLEPHCLELFKLSRTTTNCNYCTTASFLFRSQNTTVQFTWKHSLLYNNAVSIVMLPFSVVLLQQTHCYTTWTVTLLWKCNILSVTQQELLRYYGNAIWCIDHVTKANPICHNIVASVKKRNNDSLCHCYAFLRRYEILCSLCFPPGSE
jgi:hypothetical protein